MNLLFDNFHQWKVCFLSGCRKAGWGLWRIFTCIILGIVSLFVFCGKQIEAFCRRETTAAVIIGVLIVALSFGWISTFMSGRTMLRTAEYERDSIGHKLDKYLQAFDSTSTIVIDNDTIR